MRAHDRVGDRYELTYPVGRGGMGEVWAGYDEKLDRPVAIKFLRDTAVSPDDRDSLVDRFMREARVTARLDHPGVPTVHDVGFHGRDIYLVMQLVPGMVLADLIAEQGRLSVPWAAAIGAQVCSVLAAAHAASLVHRDLKPQNLMLTPAGTVKVLDFGVAALLATDVPRLTMTGETVGTPTYMAPEQALSNTVGPHADLYALGCVLFELLAGRPPYQAETALGVLQRHLNDPVPSVTELRADVPDDLVRLLGRMLAKDPQDRPASAAEVYRELLPLATVDLSVPDEPVTTADGQAADPTTPYRYPFGPLPRNASPSASSREPIAAEPAGLSLDELADVRERALELAEAERFTQAAEVLATALRGSVPAHGSRHPRILDVRLDHANLLVLAGAYRQALPELRRLVTDLAERLGPDDELVWQCRQQAATCQAELGDGTEALAALRALRADQEHVLAADEPGLFPLRQQIALVSARVGEVTVARRELRELLRDTVRAYGAESPEAHELRRLLDHLDRLA